MRFFLEKASEHLNKGLEFQNKGKYKEARYHYLKAAEFLFKAAKKSIGELKEKRISQAEELLKRAHSLESLAGIGVISRTDRGKLLAEDEEAARWIVTERPNIRFSDIAGLDQVKEEIFLKIIYPVTNPEQAEKYGVKAGGGILLYGPPGTGKTMMAKATANEIEATFFAVKPSEIMSKWVGEAEQNIEKLFQAAKRYDRAIIFIDEIEALAPSRSESGSTVMQRVVPQILGELEGIKSKKEGLLFIGATNVPWKLDYAILRPGRFDEKIYVPLPDYEASKKILELNLSGKPLADDISFDEIAKMLEGYSGADIANICRKACNIPFLEAIKTGEERNVEMRDILSVIHETKPSVSQKDLKKFEQFSSEK